MRVSSVVASASAFIHASISTSPEAASVTMAVIRPSASNFGWKRRLLSTSAGVPREANSADGAAAMTRLLNLAGWPVSAARPMHHLQETVAIAGVGLERAGEPRG